MAESPIDKVTFRLSQDLHRKIKAHLVLKGTSLQDFLADHVKATLAKADTESEPPRRRVRPQPRFRPPREGTE